MPTIIGILTFMSRKTFMLSSRLRFELEKLRNPDVTGTFQATIGGKFTLLINLRDNDIAIVSMITNYYTAVTDTASEIFGKKCRRKKPWVTRDVVGLCDERRDWKKEAV